MDCLQLLSYQNFHNFVPLIKFSIGRRVVLQEANWFQGIRHDQCQSYQVKFQSVSEKNPYLEPNLVVYIASKSLTFIYKAFCLDIKSS